MSASDVAYAFLLEQQKLANTEEPSSSIDLFFTKKAGQQIKLSSVGQLRNFIRIGKETLIHKAEKDLWKLTTDKSGNYVIERLFEKSIEG